MSTAVKSAVATVKSACVVPSRVTPALLRRMVMQETRRFQGQVDADVCVWRISSQRLSIATALANLRDCDGDSRNENSKVEIREHDLMAGTTPAATAPTSAREPTG